MAHTPLVTIHAICASIDRTATIEVFGYDPARLRPSSCKLVICRCPNCAVQRQKFYRYADMLCAKCSNRINSSTASSRLKRSIKMADFYAAGGRHPTKGIGHTDTTRKKISQSRSGKK